MQGGIFWIWLARNFNLWQWTLLYCRCIYQHNECIPCQSYHKVTPVPTIQWTCWKVCTDCEKLILQSNKEGKIYSRLIPVSNAGRQQLGLQPEKLRTMYKNEQLPSHDLHIGQDVMYQGATSKQWHPTTIIS